MHSIQGGKGHETMEYKVQINSGEGGRPFLNKKVMKTKENLGRIKRTLENVLKWQNSCIAFISH